MGNTCQTDRNLKPSVYLTDKQDELYHQPNNNAQQLQLISPSQPRIIKPIILINSGRHSNPTITALDQRKRCNKNFLNLHLKLGDKTSQQILMRRNLKKTSHIATLDLDLRSTNLGLAKQFTAFITELKHFKKIPNLQINYANLPYENFQKFCFAIKHLKAPKKFNAELWYNRYTRNHKPQPVIRAFKKFRDLRDLSIEFTSIEDLKPKPFERIFSSLKRHKNVQTLKVKYKDLTKSQAAAFNKGMKHMCHFKLSKITLDIGQREDSDAFIELFGILTNFASLLQSFSLWRSFYDRRTIVFSQHLSKFTHLSHLKIRGWPGYAASFDYIEHLMDGLKSRQNLPTNFRVGFGFPWEDQGNKVDKAAFIRLYPRLAFEKWSYSVKVEINKERELVFRRCYLEDLQSRSSDPSGLQIDFKACVHLEDLTGLLDQVNLTQELFIELSKVDIYGLKKIFESLKKFAGLTSFIISFTRCYQIDKKWIETLFDLLLQLPPSVAFLKLWFAECISLTPKDIQFITSSLTRLRKMKNLTGIGLTYADIVQFTDENGIELAKELKQMTQLTNVELSFKGCYMLKGQGVLSLIENVKTLPGLQKGTALFEDCWNIQQSTIDSCQIESKNFSVKFYNCKQGNN